MLHHNDNKASIVVAIAALSLTIFKLQGTGLSDSSSLTIALSE